MWTSGAAAWLLACNRTPRRFHQPAKAAWQSWAADEPQGGRTLERRMRPLFLSAMLFLAASSLARADDLACVSTTFSSDKVCVSNFDDPKVPGVTCFISQARKGECHDRGDAAQRNDQAASHLHHGRHHPGGIVEQIPDG